MHARDVALVHNMSFSPAGEAEVPGSRPGRFRGEHRTSRQEGTACRSVVHAVS